MTVRELIEQLALMPSDAEVVIEERGRFESIGVELEEGPNSPAAEWPLRPFVVIEAAKYL